MLISINIFPNLRAVWAQTIIKFLKFSLFFWQVLWRKSATVKLSWFDVKNARRYASVPARRVSLFVLGEDIVLSAAGILSQPTFLIPTDSFVEIWGYFMLSEELYLPEEGERDLILFPSVQMNLFEFRGILRE